MMIKVLTQKPGKRESFLQQLGHFRRNLTRFKSLFFASYDAFEPLTLIFAALNAIFLIALMTATSVDGGAIAPVRYEPMLSGADR